MGKGIRTVLALLGGFAIAWVGCPAALAVDDATCEGCHSDKGNLSDAGARAEKLVVVANSLKGSVHEGISCTDCHKDLAGDAAIPHPSKLAAAACDSCHGEVVDTFRANSIHFHLMKPGDGFKSGCAACHGNHKILKPSDPNSPVHRRNLADTCAKCHKDPGDGSGPVEAWKRSIHGRSAIEGDIDEAPTCNVCHKPHEIRKAEDPAEPVNRRNQMNVCGACHSSELKTVLRGVHGKAWKAGNLASAICSDCHGAHDIQRIHDRGSHVYASSVSQACGRCHGDADLTSRFHLRPDSVATYNESYHGRGTRWGASNVANCASCHRYHDVRAAADPASSVNPKNLLMTCGRPDCHPGATPAFLSIPSHPKAVLHSIDWPRWTRYIYLLIIGATIAFMTIHQVLEGKTLAAELKHHAAAPSTTLPPRPRISPLSRFVQREGVWVVERWNSNQIVQHVLLVTSFGTLVLTGFALKIPAEWAKSMGFLGPLIFELRSQIHRVAALLMILGSVYHLFWLAFSRRGRRELVQLLPDPLHDLKDMIGSFAWFVGLRDHMPAGRRYTYREKLEYWSLVWGTIVMIVSGAILWTAPHWHWLAVRLSQIVHGYEALLALLAILIWHMLGVHLKPGIFPMNPTWLNGTMPLAAMKEEHRAEYDLMVAWEGFDPLEEKKEGGR